MIISLIKKLSFLKSVPCSRSINCCSSITSTEDPGFITYMNVKTVDINASAMTIKELLLLINEETEIVLTQDSKPLARLMPIASASPPRTPGLHPGAISTTDDFDEPLAEEFWTGKA